MIYNASLINQVNSCPLFLMVLVFFLLSGGVRHQMRHVVSPESSVQAHAGQGGPTY